MQAELLSLRSGARNQRQAQSERSEEALRNQLTALEREKQWQVLGTFEPFVRGGDSSCFRPHALER